MRALLKVDPAQRGFSLAEVPAPSVGAGEVLVRIHRVGLCGTDVGIMEWAPGLIREYQPQLPHTIGHEFCGTVVEVGPDVSSISVGQRVAVNPHLYCGDCTNCADGRQNVCVRRPILGCHIPGAAAELLAVRAQNAHPLPDVVDDALGALIEPICVALHAVERARVQEGDRVAVVGAGPVGILCALVLRASGCTPTLIGIEQDAERLAFARGRGVSIAHAMPTTGGDRPDVVIEAAGTPAAVRSSYEAVRPGGRVVVVSLPHDDIPIDVAALAFKELDVLGSRAYTPDVWPRAISLVAASPETFDGVVGATYPMEQWSEALRAVSERRVLRVQIDMGSSTGGSA